MSSQFVNLPESGGGSGAVDSVNGQTGVVVLDATDVGAANTELSNLTTTAINASLLFDTDSSYDIGAASERVVNLYAMNIRSGDVQLLLTGTGVSLNSSGGFVDIEAPEVVLHNVGVTATALSFADAANAFSVKIKAPDSLSANSVYELPEDYGTAGQVLTDVAGDGVLSWEDAGGGGSPGGNSGNFQYNNSGSFAGNDNINIATVAGETILKVDSANNSTVMQFGDSMFIARSGNTIGIANQIYYDNDAFKRATGLAGSLMLFAGDSIIVYQSDAGAVDGTPSLTSPMTIAAGGVFQFRGSTFGGASSGYVWTLINASTGECGWVAP